MRTPFFLIAVALYGVARAISKEEGPLPNSGIYVLLFIIFFIMDIIELLKAI